MFGQFFCDYGSSLDMGLPPGCFVGYDGMSDREAATLLNGFLHATGSTGMLSQTMLMTNNFTWHPGFLSSDTLLNILNYLNWILCGSFLSWTMPTTWLLIKFLMHWRSHTGFYLANPTKSMGKCVCDQQFYVAPWVFIQWQYLELFELNFALCISSVNYANHVVADQVFDALKVTHWFLFGQSHQVYGEVHSWPTTLGHTLGFDPVTQCWISWIGFCVVYFFCELCEPCGCWSSFSMYCQSHQICGEDGEVPSWPTTWGHTFGFYPVTQGWISWIEFCVVHFFPELCQPRGCWSSFWCTEGHTLVFIWIRDQ